MPHGNSRSMMWSCCQSPSQYSSMSMVFFVSAWVKSPSVETIGASSSLPTAVVSTSSPSRHSPPDLTSSVISPAVTAALSSASQFYLHKRSTSAGDAAAQEGLATGSVVVDIAQYHGIPVPEFEFLPDQPSDMVTTSESKDTLADEKAREVWKDSSLLLRTDST